MTADTYAQATYDLIAGGMTVGEALQKLDRLLAARGHKRLEKRILREVMRIAEQEASFDLPVVTVDEEKDAARFSREIAAALKELGVTKDGEKRTETALDTNLVGGYRVSYRGHEIDASYKRALATIYRNAVSPKHG
jgi:F0F1-type ATP synthase delta subunit